MSAPTKKLHPDFIEEVTRRTDIVDVISQQIELKKRGREYQGLCPFHNEKTPSFSVSPNKGLAYCFGCSWGGNAIKFLMELGKVSFTDAVMELARQTGVPIRYEDGSTEDLPASSLIKPRKIPQQGRSDQNICQFDLPARDAAYRKLTGKLDLSRRHREKLRSDRSLTDDQINFAYQQGSIRTWQPGNNIFGISSELPGVNPKTGKLTGVEGIAIAALNPTNQITGFQLAPDNKEKFGKYIWLSSNNQGGSGPYLPNGELPIFCWKHPDADQISEVWKCEGALKSLLVALRLWFEGRTDVVVIGSASSARYGEKTLRDYLAQLGAPTIRLMLDAGAVTNPGISSANQQTLEWLQEWGYDVSVGWWGQTDKSCDDIDELADWNAIAYISPSEFYALAREYGGIKESDSRQELDKTITRDVWELKFGVGRWLRKTITRILGKPKGFEKKPITRRQPSAAPEIIRYPFEPLPSPEDYADSSRPLPLIIFKKGYRLQLAKKLQQLGWKFVCDRSFTGAGKSYEFGHLDPDKSAVNKIWIFDLNHTNPSTETVEGKTNLPPRHNGMAVVEGKYTPLGYPQIRWPKEGEEPMIPANCHNADLFIKLKSKGWDVDSEQESIQGENGESLSRNPICKQCRYAFKCHKEEGEGYGYLKIRREVMESREIRASLDSAPNPFGAKKYNYSCDLAVVDEASRYIRGTKTLSAWGNEIARLWQYVERNAPEAFEALQHIRFALQDALEGKFDRIEKGMNRGADHETLKQKLLESLDPKAIANLPKRIQQVKGAMPGIEEIVEEADSVKGCDGKWRSIGQFTRDMMKSQAAYQTQQNIENLPPNVLVDVLEILAGLKPGSLRTHRGQLQVTVQDTRHADILRACSFVVLLDATPNIPYLEKILGDRILEIEEERPPMTNLTVINVNMKGLGSNQISESCKDRELALLDWIKNQHLNAKVLAYKGDSHLPLDGHWHHDNRGSNAFKGVEALITFGTPRPNLGVIQDEYRALFCSLEGFEEYYQFLIDSEIVQLVGRQRVHQYPDQEFTLYMVSTNQDLSFLSDLGCRIENKEAFELTPLAGTPEQVTFWKMAQAMGQLQDQGEKITQEALAALIGKSQETISKFAKNLGGWSALKKLLLSLLNTYRTSNNCAELNEEARFLAESYLPLMLDTPEEAPQSLSEIVRAYGLSTVLMGLKALAPQLQARMLGGLLQHTAPSTPQETPSEKLLPSVYSPNRDSNNFLAAAPVTISETTEAGSNPAGSLEEILGDDAGSIYEDMGEVPPEEPAPAPVPGPTKPLIIIPGWMRQAAAGIAAAVISTHPAAAAPQNCGIQPVAVEPPPEISQSAENSPTPLDFLIDRLAAVKNQQEFWQIVEGHDSERIEDALLYQEPCHRAQLRRWYEAPPPL